MVSRLASSVRFLFRRVAWSTAAGGALVALACVPPGDGVSPPLDRIYFPVGLSMEPGYEHLVVVGSDFDLQFNQGTIHSLDLETVRKFVAQPCQSDSDCAGDQRCDVEPSDSNQGAASYVCVARSGRLAGDPCHGLGEKPPEVRFVSPGRCAPVDLATKSEVVSDVVQISAFATGSLLVPRPSNAPPGAGARLLVPLRGDSSLHWFELSDGRIECGQASEGGRCSSRYRVQANGDVITNSDTGTVLTAPPEPYGLAASEDGAVIAVTHQLGGYVSAYDNSWDRDPSLTAIASGLPLNVIGVAAVPLPASRSGQSDGPLFLTSFRNAAEVHLLRYFPQMDPGPTTERLAAQLVDVGGRSLTINSSGVVSRGLAIDGRRRRAAEAGCNGDAACLQKALSIPLDYYLANRSPNSLLIGQSTHQGSDPALSDLPTFYQNVPLPEGPSQVVLGEVMTDKGPSSRVFVVCFDAAIIYVYDPELGRVESELPTGRGPQAIAFDDFAGDSGSVRPLMYVAHFTDSTVGVMSLDQRFPRTYGSTLATIGVPTAPRAAK